MNDTLINIISAKPFLKWAGGKSQIIPELEMRLPDHIRKSKVIKNYVEPFIGGGAFFFYLSSQYKIQKSIIIDINPELYIAYNVIKLKHKDLIDNLNKYENEFLSLDNKNRETFFYDIRSKYNSQLKEFNFTIFNNDWIDRCAHLIFLNRTCFNGLFRQNKKGEFNVPYGNYKKPSICNMNNIIECSKALINTIILQGDFLKSSSYIDNDTLVYLDPPYRPINKTASFTSYSKDGFNDDDQIRLAEFYKEMSKKGAYLLLSNSDPQNKNPNDTFFEKIYNCFTIDKVFANRMINCNGNQRGKITELLINNYQSRGGFNANS